MADPTPPWESKDPTPPWETKTSPPSADPDKKEYFGNVLSRRASDAIAQRPPVNSVPKNTQEFLDQTKSIIPGTEKALAAGTNLVASPLGAIGETAEYKAARAAGIQPEKARGVAKDTGDVSEALLGLVPGIKGAPGAIANSAEKVASLPKKAFGAIREGINTASDKMAAKSIPTPTAASIKTEAQAAYADAAKKGGVLSPAFTDKFLAEVRKFSPQTNEGKAFSGDTAITKLIERANTLKGQPISLQGAEEIDKALTSEVSEHFSNGKLDEQGKKILDFQTKFRDMIENASGEDVPKGKEGFDALKLARAKWSQAARMGDIEAILTRADSMDNPATAIKTGFRTLYNNKGRIKGFSTQEKEAIKNAAESGKITDMLRVFGSRLIPIAHLAGGGGIPGSVAAHGATTAIRSGAEALQMRRAQKVKDLIAARKMPVSADEALGSETDPLAAGAKP